MKKERICPLTGQIIPKRAHGNRKYFPDEKVEKQRKAKNNNRRYQRVRDISNLAIALDKILERHYPHSKETTFIDQALVKGFDFDFVTTKSPTNPPIFWIINYGYSFNDKMNKIKIHYDASAV